MSQEEESTGTSSMRPADSSDAMQMAQEVDQIADGVARLGASPRGIPARQDAFSRPRISGRWGRPAPVLPPLSFQAATGRGKPGTGTFLVNP